MMCFRRASLTLLLFALALPVRATWISPFISEIHYDNVNGDVNEMIAVTGPSGLDLSGWQLVLYNGANGRPYDSIALSGRLAQTAEMWAEAFWPVANIQNGPDAVALLGPSEQVVDFIAYEAAVTATTGPALGVESLLLPVSEGAATAMTSSLQREGSADEWLWRAGPATPGVLNPGLRGLDAAQVPIPGTLQLWSALLAGLIWIGVRGAGGRPVSCRLTG